MVNYLTGRRAAFLSFQGTPLQGGSLFASLGGASRCLSCRIVHRVIPLGFFRLFRVIQIGDAPVAGKTGGADPELRSDFMFILSSFRGLAPCALSLAIQRSGDWEQMMSVGLPAPAPERRIR